MRILEVEMLWCWRTSGADRFLPRSGTWRLMSMASKVVFVEAVM